MAIELFDPVGIVETVQSRTSGCVRSRRHGLKRGGWILFEGE